MAGCLTRTHSLKLLFGGDNLPIVTCVRQRTGLIRRRKKGKPPELSKTFEQRLEEWKMTKEEPFSKINIGFPLKDKRLGRMQMRKVLQERKEEVFRLTQLGKLEVDIDEVEQEEWKSVAARERLKIIAQHYGIFRDLFGNAFFYPSVKLDVSYDHDEEYENPVCNGNIITAKVTSHVPNVQFESEPDNLWTLLMTAPDSHLQENQLEYLHWLIGNIPAGNLNEGEVLCDYMQVFPARGTGLHRYVFILFKQDKKIDFSEEKRPKNTISLTDRTFRTFDFYEKYQDDMTPAGICFFQSEHDESVRDVFWNKLDMKEPRFEFIFPAPYHPEQKKTPHRQPFNLYLDRYRDIKDINEEVLKHRLKDVHPFQKPQPPPKYPMLYKNEKMPSWLRQKKHHMILKRMQWEDS